MQLCASLTTENAASRLVLSDQAEAEQLKEACVEFVLRNGTAVMASEGWDDVTAHNNGRLVVELFAAFAGSSSPQGKKRRAEDADHLHPVRKAAKLKAVDDMRVCELRTELNRRQLSTSGLKAVLSERLKAAIAQEDSFSDDELFIGGGTSPSSDADEDQQARSVPHTSTAQ